MVAGHFGFAAVVKSRERQTPLWALMLACQWLDVVFVPLFVLGIERITPVPGTSGGYGQVIINADYTHSLVGALGLAALFGFASTMSWGMRNGVVLGGVAFSHWCLDLIVHRTDMPLLPANVGRLPRMGFGLWQVPAASVVVELMLIVVGPFLYWRAAVAAAHAGNRGTSTAHATSALLIASGLVTLTLDVLGV